MSKHKSFIIMAGIATALFIWYKSHKPVKTSPNDIQGNTDNLGFTNLTDSQQPN